MLIQSFGQSDRQYVTYKTKDKLRKLMMLKLAKSFLETKLNIEFKRKSLVLYFEVCTPFSGGGSIDTNEV
jgi:hypothetical protein